MTEPVPQPGISFPREAVLTFVLATLMGAFWQVNPGFVEYTDGERWEWQRSLGMTAGDSPYHIRMAYLYRTGEAFEAGPNFHWTRMSIWNGTFSDKDFLYHVLLIPFTFFAQDDYDHGGLMQGAKISAAFAWGVVAISLLCALRMLGVRPAWPYVLLIAAVSWGFQMRMMEARNWFMAASCAILGWAAITRDRRALVFGIGVIYTLSYTAAHVLVALSVFHLLGRLALGPDEGSTRKADFVRNLKIVGMAALGVTAGWALHPQPIELFKLWWVQNILVIYMHNGGTVSGVIGEISRVVLGWQEIPPEMYLPTFMFGVELTPPKAKLIWGGFGAAMALPIVLGGLALALRWRPSKLHVMTMLIAVPLLAMIPRSVRFGEYAVPFIALATGLWISGMRSSPRALPWIAGARQRIWRGAWLGLVLAGVLAQGIYMHFSIEYVFGTLYPKMVKWLGENDQVRGKLIYNAGWSTFPELFVIRADCDYAAGLDPAFVVAAGTPQSRAYINIALSEYEKVAPDAAGMVKYLRDEMGADYIFVLRLHNPSLYDGLFILSQAGIVELLVRDRDFGYCLYRIP